ncbi:MAG TPA: beta-galactosidase GalB [Bacteroidota bacterium]|nr:beta-galactosidase GalB [Bacteroidota bacterium]
MPTPRVRIGGATCWMVLLSCLVILSGVSSLFASNGRSTSNFCKGWKFNLGDVPNGQAADLADSNWRTIDIPHDWSIEGNFSETNPATPSGGALPGGIGWYRKEFTVPTSDTSRLTFVEFDGIYRNSEVWINGHPLGKRPYGYSSFEYELTPYLHYGSPKNVIAVRVDNSEQPNSRWYSGSGIYRHVWLRTTAKVRVDHWGTYITTPVVSEEETTIAIRTVVRSSRQAKERVRLETRVIDGAGKLVAHGELRLEVPADSTLRVEQALKLEHPQLWSLDHPQLYRVESIVRSGTTVEDTYVTAIGIRSLRFDAERGFFLNESPVKIKGVCDHHDLGCLGAAVSSRALERQLEMLKAMGVNAIRTSHNPPAPELLDLCDRMGFVVMDEAFDMWKKGKTPFDYSLNWDEWHKADLTDMILRDRNHPSVAIWSIGNEVMEQYDPNDNSGAEIAAELSSIVRSLDPTRPITSACNEPNPKNPVIRSGALDLIGHNYHINEFSEFPSTYPGKRFIATETTSALATRGQYDLPSDSIRRWPERWDLPLAGGNPDNTCSAYDNCSTPWGSTHEETWKVVKKYDFLSGMFIWTGFDYLGEPTPYGWPSRSSYFGIIDLAGFPKDVYYMYQSEWTRAPVLHLFPHWNWRPGQTVDVWVYTNCEEVELFLNGQSLGSKRKSGEEIHLMWRLTFAPGTLRAVGRSAGREVLVREQRTAGPPAKIVLAADRALIAADGEDLSFVTATVVDDQETIVPDADNLIHFAVSGKGRLAGLDNGCQTSHESFVGSSHKAFNGLCLAVLRSEDVPGEIRLTATAEGLVPGSITINSK